MAGHLLSSQAYILAQHLPGLRRPWILFPALASLLRGPTSSPQLCNPLSICEPGALVLHITPCWVGLVAHTISHLRPGGVGTECTGCHDLHSKFSDFASSLLCDLGKELSFSLPPLPCGSDEDNSWLEGMDESTYKQGFEQLGLKENILAVANIIIKLHTGKSEILFFKSAFTIRLGF